MAIQYVLLQVILVPLFTSLVTFALGGKLGRRVGWIAFASLLYSALLLVLVGAGIFNGGGDVREVYTWAPVAGLQFGFLGDNLSLPVALIMDLVLAATSIYSMGYMKHRLEAMFGEDRKDQYALYYVNFMLLAVGLLGVALSTNLIELYLFVELMLIPSFFLMSLFGYVDREKIAVMYFIWNHLGAFLFFAGIILAFIATGSFDIGALSNLRAGSIAYWVAFLFLIGWLVKMAIFGLHMWLPYAHAEHPTSFAPIMATIVGVGNYVLIRLLVGGMPTVFKPFAFPLMIVALITMVYGGAVTLVQNDVKYLYAWSTISQNAYSVLGIGSLIVLGVSGGAFYFLSHIIGKAILFMVAGILLSQTGVRDIAKMGGLASKMPVTATLCILGSLILSAVPPTSGFQAEWIMFTGVFTQGVFGTGFNLLVALLGIAATALTVGYTFWPLRRIFFGRVPDAMRDVKEAPWVMTAPLLALALISLLLGLYPDLVTKLLVHYANALGLAGGR